MIKLQQTLCFLCALLGWQLDVVAQAYPTKPIRLIVATAPGGGVDTTARALSKAMSGIIGQPLVVENRAGAGGVPGTEVLAKSPPDGYTLQLASSSHVVNPGLYPKLPYD